MLLNALAQRITAAGRKFIPLASYPGIALVPAGFIQVGDVLAIERGDANHPSYAPAFDFNKVKRITDIGPSQSDHGEIIDAHELVYDERVMDPTGKQYIVNGKPYTWEGDWYVPFNNVPGREEAVPCVIDDSALTLTVDPAKFSADYDTAQDTKNDMQNAGTW